MDKNLSSIVNVGLFSQYVATSVLFSAKTEKHEMLRKFKKLVEEFENTLTEEEKKQWQEDIERMMKNKTNSILEEMRKSLSDEEIQKFLSKLKQK